MKKVLSIMLAVMMLASLFAVNAGATVIDPTYTVVEGASDEVVYIAQDFSDVENNAEFTTVNYSGALEVIDGTLKMAGSIEASASVSTTSSLPIGSGEFIYEFDVMRNDDLTADLRMFMTIQRAANAESADANLQKYGVIIPLRTTGLATLEDGTPLETTAESDACDLEKGKWYTYRLTFSEATYIAKNDVKQIVIVERKPKDGGEWEKYKHVSNWNFPASSYRAVGANNVTTYKATTEVVMGLEADRYAEDLVIKKKIVNDLGEEEEVVVKSEDGRNVDVRYDNIKVYTPANPGVEVEKSYPLVKGVSNLIMKDETTINNYAGENANPREYKFTTNLDAVTEGAPVRCTEITFDAINTVKGVPINIHLGAGGKCYGFDILSKDEMLGKWYTYKAVFGESATGTNLGLSTICRRPADGSGEWEVYDCSYGSDLPEEEMATARIAGWWNDYILDNAIIHIRGSLSGTATNRVRISWKKNNAALADKDVEDLTKTEWKFRNIQVITDAFAAGEATVADGVLTVDADCNIAMAPATPVLAIYDAEDRMVDVDFTTLDAGLGKLELSADYADGNKAMIFFWKEFGGKDFACEPWDITADITK